MAAKCAIKNFEKIAYTINQAHTDNLLRNAKTTLRFKIINKCHEQMAKIAVDAVMAVADFKTKDVNFELIKGDFSFLCQNKDNILNETHEADI